MKLHELNWGRLTMAGTRRLRHLMVVAATLGPAACAPDFTVVEAGAAGAGGTSATTSSTVGGGGTTSSPTTGDAGGGAPGGEPLWALALDGDGDADVRAIAVADGGIFAGVEFTGALSVGALQSAGATDVAVMQILPEGVFGQTVAYGDENPQECLTMVAVDGGDLLVAGAFSGELSAGGQPVQADGRDGFVLRLAGSGEPVWLRAVGGPGSDECGSLSVDPAGDIWAACTFTGTFEWGGSPVSSSGLQDVMLARMSGADGSPQSALTRGDAFSQRAAGLVVAADGRMTVWYDSATPSGTTDIEVASADANGNTVWTAKIATAGDDHGVSMGIDGEGRAILTGTKAGGVELGGTVIGGQAFVVAFEPDGTVAYARGMDAPDGIAIGGIAVGVEGGAVLTGSFRGSLAVGAEKSESAGGWDVFVLRLDTEGDVAWLVTFGAEGESYGRSVAFDADGAVLVGGQFDGMLSVGGTVVGPAGGMDGFVAKLSL